MSKRPIKKQDEKPARTGAGRGEETEELDVETLSAPLPEPLSESFDDMGINIPPEEREGMNRFDDDADDGELDGEVDLSDTALEGGLTDDPVRMYLKEIGLVPLLGQNRETWLSSQMAALSLLTEFQLQAADEDDGSHRATLYILYENLLQFWEEVTLQAAANGIELPDLLLITREAQALRRNYNAEHPVSYVRQYLDRGEWGRDDHWTELARSAFEVFQALYLIPSPYQDRVAEMVERESHLPTLEQFAGWLYENPEQAEAAAEKEFREVRARANEAAEALAICCAGSAFWI
jgi:hypothetical protein